MIDMYTRKLNIFSAADFVHFEPENRKTKIIKQNPHTHQLLYHYPYLHSISMFSVSVP